MSLSRFSFMSYQCGWKKEKKKIYFILQRKFLFLTAKKHRNTYTETKLCKISFIKSVLFLLVDQRLSRLYQDREKTASLYFNDIL